MTTEGSKKPPESSGRHAHEALASLLHGLRYRGLVVGPDDAARVTAAFRHAAGWSHQRRVRALKALLARSDEERLIIDQLAPLLFLNAHIQAEAEPTQQDRSPIGEIPGSRAGTRIGASPDEALTSELIAARRPRLPRLGWLVLLPALVLFGLLSVRVAGPLLHRWPRPHVPDAGVGTILSPPIPPPQPVPIQGLQTPAPKPEVRCGPLQLPTWPYLLVCGISAAIAGTVLWRFVHARAQQRNIERLSASPGPRTYEISYPAGVAAPLPAGPLREAAFYLSAPTQDVVSPWLDGARTVRATLRRAGRLSLRYGTVREQRPMLFIEDVSPSMACWPDHGRQIAEALRRQGTEVVHRFMNGTPENLARDRDLMDSAPLLQEIAHLRDPVIVVWSDAAAVTHGAQAPWLAPIAPCVWLHPRPLVLWNAGARWLCERLAVISASEEGLLRLGTPQRDGAAEIPPRWHAPRSAGSGILASLHASRAALGDPSFFFLAAAAVLDRVGVLTTRLFWALHSESVLPPAPWERLERVFELTSVTVAASGAMTLREDFREALLTTLLAERPAHLSSVVLWADRLIAHDLRQIDPSAPAALTARIARARLLSLDPRRHREALRELRRLARDGYGDILAQNSPDDERETWGIWLPRRKLPRWPEFALGTGAFLLLMGGGTLLMERGWRQRIAAWTSPAKPVIEFLIDSPHRLDLYPDTEIKFCDQNPRGGGRLLARRLPEPPIVLFGQLDRESGRYTFRLTPNDELFRGQIAGNPFVVEFGYSKQAMGPWYTFSLGLRPGPKEEPREPPAAEKPQPPEPEKPSLKLAMAKATKTQPKPSVGSIIFENAFGRQGQEIFRDETRWGVILYDDLRSMKWESIPVGVYSFEIHAGDRPICKMKSVNVLANRVSRIDLSKACPKDSTKQSPPDMAASPQPAPTTAAPKPGGEPEDPDITNEAKLQYKLGRDAYETGRYAVAINYFKRAYLLKRIPEIVISIAQAYQKTKDYEMALYFYRKFLAEAPPEDKARTQAKAAIAEVEREQNAASTPPKPDLGTTGKPPVAGQVIEPPQVHPCDQQWLQCVGPQGKRRSPESQSDNPCDVAYFICRHNQRFSD